MPLLILHGIDQNGQRLASNEPSVAMAFFAAHNHQKQGAVGRALAQKMPFNTILELARISPDSQSQVWFVSLLFAGRDLYDLTSSNL